MMRQGLEPRYGGSHLLVSLDQSHTEVLGSCVGKGKASHDLRCPHGTAECPINSVQQLFSSKLVTEAAKKSSCFA